MSVPNHLFIVERVFSTGNYTLLSHAGQAEFVDAAVLALHKHDPNWGHLKKSGSQTNIHGHGEDSALYKLPDNQAWAVDFIGGAGGPNPRLTWGPDPVAYYKHSDWFDPTAHSGSSSSSNPPPPPIIFVLPGRAEMMDEGRWLDAYYKAPEGLQRPQGLSINNAPDWEGVGAWLFDVYLAARVAGKSREQARADYVSQIRRSGEWQAKHPGETP